MQRLKACNILIDLQILDNEASNECKHIIKAEWVVGYEMVPPHIRCRNKTERAISTFKAHLLSILNGIASIFPTNLWDLLVPQIELTLNLLRQSTLNPKI